MPSAPRLRSPARPYEIGRGAWLLGAIALAFFLAAGVSMWRSARNRASWDVIEARVNSSSVATFGPRDQPRYRLHVEFIYGFEDSNYVVPVAVPDVVTSRERLTDALLQYAPGTAHRLYFNRNDPAELLFDIKAATRFFLLPALLTLAGSAVALILVFRHFHLGSLYCMGCGTNMSRPDRFCYRCGRKSPLRKGKMADA